MNGEPAVRSCLARDPCVISCLIQQKRAVESMRRHQLEDRARICLCAGELSRIQGSSCCETSIGLACVSHLWRGLEGRGMRCDEEGQMDPPHGVCLMRQHWATNMRQGRGVDFRQSNQRQSKHLGSSNNLRQRTVAILLRERLSTKYQRHHKVITAQIVLMSVP